MNIENAKKICIALADARNDKGYTIEGDAVRVVLTCLSEAEEFIKDASNSDSMLVAEAARKWLKKHGQEEGE